MQQEKTSPEHIAVSLLFYSFIIAMGILAVCRALNIGLFANGYISIETSKVVYYAVAMSLHALEGFLILSILTKLRSWYCLLIAACYTALINLIDNHTINMLLDLVYAFSIPFIFNKDKQQSIKNSTWYFVGVCIYQLLMSFGRYDVALIHKYDLGYAVLSFIDYKLFLITIKLYQIKRRVN